MADPLIKAVIFDLDGVIIDTAKHHYAAWRRLANAIGFDFTPMQNERLKGVSRMRSLDIILEIGEIDMSDLEKENLAAIKNKWYVDLISRLNKSDLLSGVLSFFDLLKKHSIKIGLGSSSKNAKQVLVSTGIMNMFDVIVDGHGVKNTKPDPEVFLNGAKAMGVKPNECLVIEDAARGIEAAIKGGFWTLGIGKEKFLNQAHAVISGLDKANMELIENIVNQTEQENP